MSSHYISIRDFLHQWIVPYYSKGDWKTHLFQDITYDGKEVAIVPAQGQSIGICGERYFCEATRDNRREDGLFVFRVELADRRLPRTVPIKYRAEFELIQSVAPNRILDSVAPLISLVGKNLTETIIQSELKTPKPRAEALPSSELKQLIRAVGQPRPRAWFCPRVISTSSILDHIQEIWKRFNLSRELQLTPRQRSILSGDIRSPSSAAELTRCFSEQLDFKFLNRYVANQRRSPAELSALLDRIAPLEIDQRTRHFVWQNLVVCLPADLQREELIFSLNFVEDANGRADDWLETIAYVSSDLAESLGAPISKQRFIQSGASAIQVARSQLKSIAPLCLRPAASLPMPETLAMTSAAATEPPPDDRASKYLDVKTGNALRQQETEIQAKNYEKQVALLDLLNRPVDITLMSGERLPSVVISSIGTEVVFLASGGMLSLKLLGAIFPCAKEARESPGISNFRERPPEPEAIYIEKAVLEDGPRNAAELSEYSSSKYKQESAEASSDPVHSGAAALAENEVVEVFRHLKREAEHFVARAESYTWSNGAIPMLPQRFPGLEASAAERAKALKLWGQAVNQLRGNSFAAALDSFRKLVGLLPAAVEPVWGAAIASASLGNKRTALGYLLFRPLSLAVDPVLGRAAVSIAIELGLLQTADDILRGLLDKNDNFAEDCILFLCKHGLFRAAVRILEQNGKIWQSFGPSLPAFLLLNSCGDETEAVCGRVSGRPQITLDGTISLLLTFAQDQPGPEYKRASGFESLSRGEFAVLHKQLREEEENTRLRRRLTAVEAEVEVLLKNANIAEAQLSVHNYLKSAVSPQERLLLQTISNDLQRKAKSNFSSDMGEAGGRIKEPSRKIIDDKRPLWRQASDAAVDGRLDEAIEKYNAYLQMAVNTGWTEQADKSLNGLAMVYDRLQERERAIEVMLEHRKFIRSTLRFNNQIATLYYLSRQFEKAAEHFLAVAKEAPNYLDGMKARKNAEDASNRAAAQKSAGLEPLAEVDTIGETLAREFLELPLNLQAREVTQDLDSFLEPDIERLSKAGMEMFGLSRGRVAREEFDYKSVVRLIEDAKQQESALGVRSQLLASALYVIYQKGWHQNAEALTRFNPSFLQTQLAASLGDDAAAQNRNEVAREYYACVLARSPPEDMALFKVKDYIRTFTGERFGFRGEQRQKMERVKTILEFASEARERLVLGVLGVASLSLNAYNAVREAIDPIEAAFLHAIDKVLPTLNGHDAKRFEEAVNQVYSQQRRIEDQFYRFRRPIGSGSQLLASCEAFVETDTTLANNSLDFGPDGRVDGWRKGLVKTLQQYLVTKSANEKELRYQQATAQFELAREEIKDFPTRFSRLSLLPILAAWYRALQTIHVEWETTVVPELDVRCLQVRHHKLGFEVELLVANGRLSRTAHEIRVFLQPALEGWTARPISQSEDSLLGTLEGGREEPQSWLITCAGGDIAPTMPANAKISHVDHQGRVQESDHFLEIPIRPIPFDLTTNPYDPGPPVQREDMLKGREDLVKRLVEGVSNREASPFFRVVGARRVGKSSIVEAVLRRLRKNEALLVTDRLDVSAMGSNLRLEAILHTWSSALVDEAGSRKCHVERWQPSAEVPHSISFLKWIERDLTPVGHPVILLDEFQAIATKLDDVSLKDFMDFWKYMVEKRVLSGIICGVDSMDQLIAERGFGNQFASIKAEKVDYLSNEAAIKLMTEPIPLPMNLPEEFADLRGKSRYTAGAIAMVLELTAASPYYLQLLCHVLVQILNDDRNMLITEMTVRKATVVLDGKVELATTFENLTVFKLAPDLRRSTLSDSEMLREIEGRLLYSIAFATQDRPYCDVSAELGKWAREPRAIAQRVFTSLVQRGVVVPNDTGQLHRVRVGLFQRWLRNNRIFGDHPALEKDDM